MPSRARCRRLRRWVALVGAVVGMASTAAAAPSAVLTVRVLDQTGLIIVGARVTAVDVGVEKSGAPAECTTDATGNAVLPVVIGHRYDVRVEFPGFAPAQIPGVAIRNDRARLVVGLAVAGVTEEVVVSVGGREERSNPRGSAFRRFLTEDDLRMLPDEPAAFERAIRDMAGPGASIRVDGFQGARLPPKSAISKIRFTYSDFTAELHEHTSAMVDIETKPGIDRFSGSIAMSGRDSRLNARDPGVTGPAASSTGTIAAGINGPIVPGRSSFMTSMSVTRETAPRPINALLPDGPVREVVNETNRTAFVWASLAWAMPAHQTFHLRYLESDLRSANGGVGGLDLRERAVDSELTDRQLALTLEGSFGSRLFNQLRVRASLVRQGQTPLSSGPAVVVMGAFSGGGAQPAGERSEVGQMVADDLDFAWKRHAFRVGTQIETTEVGSNASENLNGTFTFASLEDYRLGRAQTFTRRLGDPALQFRLWNGAGYVQDDIRVTPGLSVSAGLRLEAQSGATGRFNPAPRLSVSWSPSERHATAIRVGVGRYLTWIGPGTVETAYRLDGTRQRELVVRDPAYPLPDVPDAAILFGPSNRYELAPSLSMPASWRYSAAIEHRISGTTSLLASVSYVRGSGLLRGVRLEGASTPDPSSPAAAPTVIQTEGAGSRDDRQLRLQVWWRPAGVLSLTAAYMWGRTLDDTDGAYALPADPRNLAAEWGPASGDARHRLLVTALVRPRPNVFLLASVWGQSGTPFSLRTGRDDNGDGFVTDRPAGVGRNSARGDARWLTNVSLQWHRDLGGAAAGAQASASRRRPPVLDLSIDGENVLNRVNPITYVGVVGSPLFGKSVAALPGRRLSFRAGVSFR